MARRRVKQAAALLVVAALAATCGATGGTLGPPGWDSPGLIGGGGRPHVITPISESDAEGAAYAPGSSVIILSDGRARLIPHGGHEPITVPADDPRVKSVIDDDHAWLAAGTVPGTSPVHREMAGRALLDLRLLTAPSGASTASWYGIWNYVWPRDAAFHAAAFAATGHPREAHRILDFLSKAQGEDGRWATRYRPDGSAVNDGRTIQLDEMGWVLWATWFLRSKDQNDEHWPMVRKAADWIASSLGPDGLPPASSDYFERKPSTEQLPHRPTLGVSAPLLAGLRSAAAYAAADHPELAERWGAAARRLADGIKKEYGTHGYPRSPLKGGNMDSSVTFLAPPFGAPNAEVDAAVGEAVKRLRVSNGGVLPGEGWKGNLTEAWTPEVAMFALAAAAGGRDLEATTWLDWLADHRTPLGVLPEKVDSKHKASSVAPLGWTASLVLLALVAQEEPLPTP